MCREEGFGHDPWRLSHGGQAEKDVALWVSARNLCFCVFFYLFKLHYKWGDILNARKQYVKAHEILCFLSYRKKMLASPCFVCSLWVVHHCVALKQCPSLLLTHLTQLITSSVLKFSILLASGTPNFLAALSQSALPVPPQLHNLQTFVSPRAKTHLLLPNLTPPMVISLPVRWPSQPTVLIASLIFLPLSCFPFLCLFISFLREISSTYPSSPSLRFFHFGPHFKSSKALSCSFFLNSLFLVYLMDTVFSNEVFVIRSILREFLTQEVWGGGPRNCICNKFLCDADLGTSYWEP